MTDTVVDAHHHADFDGIAELLTGAPSSAVVAGAIEDAEQGVLRLEALQAEQRKISLDPLVRTEVAESARREAASLAFQTERLKVAIESLRREHEVALKCEAEEDYRRRHAEVLAERDALAQELRDKYPAIAAELADLLSRVKANNERVTAINRGAGAADWIHPAETIARGVPPSGVHFLCTSVHLPPMDHSEHAMGQMLWPLSVPFNPASVVPKALREAEARAGAEIRRVAEVVSSQRVGARHSRRKNG